jgi:hypothetical protein
MQRLMKGKVGRFISPVNLKSPLGPITAKWQRHVLWTYKDLFLFKSELISMNSNERTTMMADQHTAELLPQQEHSRQSHNQ